MNDLIDSSRINEILRVAEEWVLTNVLVWHTLAQVVLLLGLFLAAHIIARRLTPFLDARVERIPERYRLRALLGLVPRYAQALLFLALLWLVIGILMRVTWPSYSYLLRLVASLATAWIAISLSSHVIRNPVMSRAVALLAWTVAALNITGLLGPTVATLDAVALYVGELRLSLLTVVKGVVSLAILLWVATTVGRVLETRIQRMPDLTPSVQVLLGKLLKITLLALAVVVALNAMGIDLTALAVLSGAIGLGIGFGLQKVVSNLISGVILLLDKSIKPGDVIELGETFGWISSLGARYVSVVTRDGKEYLIPNEDLITHRVVNWSYTNKLVRLEITFGVSYDSDPHKVREIATQAAQRPARVVPDPAPVCHLQGFGDSSLDFLLRFWIRDPQQGVSNVTGEVFLALWDALKENGVGIPYPHREVILRERPPAPSQLAAAQ